MTAAMPWVFAALAALALGATVVALYQAMRALLGSVDEADVVDDRIDAGERALFDRRHALLEALAALDLDHAAGKLSDDDHVEERARLRVEAKSVLAAIEALVGPHRADALALVDARRATRATRPADVGAAPSSSAETAAVPVLTAPADSTSAGADRAACPACGTANEADATFCKRCGKAMGEGA